MSVHLNRPLACLHFSRRRLYASQAVLLNVPISQWSEEQPIAGSSSGTPLTPTMNPKPARHPNDPNIPHQGSVDLLERRRTEKYNETFKLSRNPLEPNKVDLYLASLRAAGLEPTLADIERCRPHGHSHPSSPQYAQDYNALTDVLCRSFTKMQLRRFTDLYGLPKMRSMRKLQYAENIVEMQWKWPSLKDIERQKRDTTEVSTKFFDVTPSELFLILGKDGADLLQISTRYNVHISLTPDPLALRVEGLRGSLKKFAQYLTKLRGAILEDTFELPTRMPVRQDLVQRISRISGAFIENLEGNGAIRLYVKDSRHLVAAKRLATRAVCEVHGSPPTPLSLYVPPCLPSWTPVPTALFPDSYSVYPFLSPRSLPWTMNTGGSFRIRRVGEWLGVNSNEDIQKTGGLAEGNGRFVTLTLQPRELKEHLFANLPDSVSPSTTVITASFGHVLITSPTPAQRASILSPIKGHLPLSKILKWLQDSSSTSAFVPSLPFTLLNSAPTEQRFMHRLVYYALPKSTSDELAGHFTRSMSEMGARKIIKYEIVLPQPESLFDRTVVESSTASRSPGELPGVEYEPGESRSMSGLSQKVMANQIKLRPRYWSGLETTVNLMIPDRPSDIRFSVLSSAECSSGQEPTELQSYLSELRRYLENGNAETTQPDPPLKIIHHGDTYVLHTNASVRQSTETIPATGSEIISRSRTDVVIESLSDLESNHKSTLCQVTCDAHECKENWVAFLHSCDHMTSTISQRSGNATQP